MTHFTRQAKALVLLSIVVWLLPVAGCSNSVSMSGWQQSLERYVAEQHHNDLSFLRKPDQASTYRQFTILGGNSPDQSTDVAGILLGRRTLDGTDWLVFLMASVKKRTVDDIRIAMLSDEHGNRHWLLSGENPQSLAAYQRYRLSVWQKNHPNREDPPLNADIFPTEDDVFRLDIAGNTVSVLEVHSGVRWTLVRNPVILQARMPDAQNWEMDVAALSED